MRHTADQMIDTVRQILTLLSHHGIIPQIPKEDRPS